MKLLEDIDELLAYLEDTAHGEEGKRITEMRGRIQTELSNSHKPVVMQTLPFSFVEWYSGMQKEKIESAYQRWMKEGNVAVASEGMDEANTCADFCKCVSPNDCRKLDNCLLKFKYHRA